MTFLLAHLSDPHVPPLPIARLRELAGKRMLGYLNWTRNRHAKHDRVVLDTLVKDMQAQRPDHVAVTGDLVNLSLQSEYAPARRWIESVGPGNQVTIVPGNHDAYVRGALDRFNRTFADYLTGDVPRDDFYPFVRRRGDIVVVTVSSAVATPPLMATGRLGQAQRTALDAILMRLASEPVFRIVLIHHPLRSDEHRRLSRLTDADDVLAILKQRGVDLVLHGHDHVHSTMRFEGPAGPFLAIGVPSASATRGQKRPPAAYNLFNIDKTDGAWRCVHTTRGFDQSGKLRELAKTRLI